MNILTDDNTISFDMEVNVKSEGIKGALKATDLDGSTVYVGEDNKVHSAQYDDTEVREQIEGIKDNSLKSDDIMGIVDNPKIEKYLGNFNSSYNFRVYDDTVMYIVPLDNVTHLSFDGGENKRILYVSEWKGYLSLQDGQLIPNVVRGYFDGSRRAIPNGSKYAIISVGGDITSLQLNDVEVLKVKENVVDKYSESKSKDILALNDLDEIKNLLNQAKYNLNGHGSVLKRETDKVCIMQISDIHDTKEQLERALRFAEYFKVDIDDIINTGDTFSVNFANGETVLDKVEGAEKILNVIGNHDYSKTSGNATETEDYNALIKHIEGVVKTENHCYYYKDYPNSKLRFVFVDLFHWTDEQKTWFSNTLADAITNEYHVVCVSHSTPLDVTKITESTFSAISSRANLSIPNSELCIEVETFKNNGGIFVCWLVGHLHANDFAYITNYPNQLVLACPSLRCNPLKVVGDVNRNIGTKSQDSFYLLVFDTDNTMVKVISVGATVDKYLRSRKTMVFNYLTKKIISNN